MDFSTSRRSPAASFAPRLSSSNTALGPLPVAGSDAGAPLGLAGSIEDAATIRLRTYLQHLKRTNPDQYQNGLDAALKRKKPKIGLGADTDRRPAAPPGYSHPDPAAFAMPHQDRIDRFLGPPSRILKHARKGIVEGWAPDDPLGLNRDTVGAMLRGGLLDYRDVPGVSVVPDAALFGLLPIADAALRAPVSLYHGLVNTVGQTNRELGNLFGPSSRIERDLKAAPEAFLSRVGGVRRTIPVRKKVSIGSSETVHSPVGPPRPNRTVPAASGAIPDRRVSESHKAIRPTFSDADVGYDLPKQRQMPIEAYYGGRLPETNRRGKLAYTPEGDPLVAPLIVGRIDSGPDRTLSPRQLEKIINSITRKRMQRVTRKMVEREDERAEQLGDSLGVAYGDETKKFLTQVLLNRHLRGRQAESVKAHEFGHGVRKVTQPEPRSRNYEPLQDEIQNEAARVYHQLNTGKAPRKNQKLFGPVDRNPEDTEIDEEFFAEAMRAYLADPNAFKSLFPDMARFVRKTVNGNPDLMKIIQFNSAAGAAALTGYGATNDPSAQNQPEAEKTPSE